MPKGKTRAKRFFSKKSGEKDFGRRETGRKSYRKENWEFRRKYSKEKPHTAQGKHA